MKSEQKTPKMLSIRQVAKTGILSEYALRQLQKQGKLPSISLNNKALINFDALIEQLQQIKGEA